MLSAFFGGLALLLAAVGLYGVVSHAVRARQMEIGLRMALGASPSSIVRLVFRRVGVLIVGGLALGLAGSLWAARFVEALLFQLEARDPVTFAGAVSVLVAVGIVAAWMPARRAARLKEVGCTTSSVAADGLYCYCTVTRGSFETGPQSYRRWRQTTECSRSTGQVTAPAIASPRDL